MLFVSVGNIDLLQSIPPSVDGVELRLDLFSRLDLKLLKNCIETSSHPLMFTLRRSSHGGQFQGSEEERKKLIQQLLAFAPPFFDLEYDMDKDFILEMTSKYPKTKFILSYHNFDETPADLENVFREMSRFPAYSYKIAALSRSTNDALRMLLFAKKHTKVSAICMGENGEFARVLGPVCGNLINYASLNHAQNTAPGQLTAEDLMQIYHFKKLNPKTSIYGLIGGHVAKSRGHLLHNQVFEKQGLNAVYVKMNVKEEELKEFLSNAKELGIAGLSVTMPLKESVLAFLNSIDPQAAQIGAVNTLLFEDGKIFGMNTDGIGALDAIEKRGSVKGKQIVIIGAGGAARAIAFVAHWRGANILILNRTIERAEQLAKAAHCTAGGLSDIPPFYDILINCTPDSMPIDPKKILPSAFVMDIVATPKETPFLLKAKELGCQLIFGEEMWENQAIEQRKLWLQ